MRYVQSLPLTPAAMSPATETDPPPSGTEPSPEAQGPSILSLPLAELRAGDPLRWLALGWADFRRAPALGLFYGLCFFLMGHALLWVFRTAPAYVLALSAGFLLMGPFLCLGLYHASRALEQGQAPRLGESLAAWRPTKGTMAMLPGVLLNLERWWGRASLVVFAVTFNTMPSADKLLPALIAPENATFLITYVMVGAVFAGLIFVTSVISIPMIMDRQVDAISAGLTSIRASLQNPGVMLCWGALITVVIGLSMLPAFVGLLVSGPVIGHATWHAYRHIVPRAGPGA